MGLHTKQIFLSSTIREFAGKHNAICIKISFSQRWTGCGWISRKAGLLPCLFDVGGSAGVPPGGGGVWRPRGGPAGRPGRQTKERTRGLWPRARSFRALRAQPPPPRRVLHQRQKGNAKARPHDLRGLAHETMVGRDAAPAPPLGQSPGPRPMGPGGINRSAAGCYPRLPTAAVARISPSAQDRVAY